MWYTAADAACSSVTGQCSATPAIVLAYGQAQWWIQTWNGGGSGPWSGGMTFVVTRPVVPPPPATLVSPAGTISTSTPTYIWNAVPTATWYYLWVNNNGTPRIQTWYTAAQAGCASVMNTCSVTPTTALAIGPAQWWIQTWNDSGYGPWSDGMAFTVSAAGPPDKATLVSPTGTVTTTTPTYTWNAVAESTRYLLYVNDSTNSNGKIQAWYTSAGAGCASGTGTCAVTPTTALAQGSCRWWIQTYNAAGYGPWSDSLSFIVGSTGTEITQATLNGTPWSGPVNYNITGPGGVITGSAVPSTTAGLQPGLYTLVYQSGGPAASTFTDMNPHSGMLNLVAGGTITFTLQFSSPATGTVRIRATLDGLPWSGTLLFTDTGGTGISATFVPVDVSPVLIGQYQPPVYVSGGPPNSRFIGSDPSTPQFLDAGGSITYTLQFVSTSSNIDLEFNQDGVLPSSQGFSYNDCCIISTPEATMISVSGGLLHLNSQGLPAAAAGAYFLWNGFTSNNDLSLEMRLKVYPGTTASSMDFQVRDSHVLFDVAISDSGVQLITNTTGTVVVPFNTTDGFHTYRLTSGGERAPSVF